MVAPTIVKRAKHRAALQRLVLNLGALNGASRVAVKLYAHKLFAQNSLEALIKGGKESGDEAESEGEGEVGAAGAQAR